ncbi:MAG: trypsin-like serine protease [Acidimicrobiia bacterium]
MLAVALTAIAIAIPVGAITNGGEPDAGEHPYVGLSVYFFDHDGDPKTPLAVSHRCSGTLISKTVYVTAGHCTFGMDVAMLWFAGDVQTNQGSNGFPDFSNLPDDFFFDAWGNRGDTVTGTPHTFPLYNDAAFFLNDLGVVVLDKAVTSAGLYDGTAGYAALPADGQFDGLEVGRHTTFTSVGYGLQRSTAAFSVADKIRLKAHPWLVQINVPGFSGDFSFLLSNNSATGGTCFGDSGGPNFIGDTTTIAGITSYGLNGSCGGTGGVWRLDRQDAIDFITSFTTGGKGKGKGKSK